MYVKIYSILYFQMVYFYVLGSGSESWRYQGTPEKTNRAWTGQRYPSSRQRTPHRAEAITLKHSLLGFKNITHSPYSPELALMFYVFPNVKKKKKKKKKKKQPRFKCTASGQAVWWAAVHTGFGLLDKNIRSVLISKGHMWKISQASAITVTAESRWGHQTSCRVTAKSIPAPLRVGYELATYISFQISVSFQNSVRQILLHMII